jgi:predicted  nucleic acid-binding Zn-ribbon protein
MASTPVAFEVERFEYLKASPTSGLLRLAGRWAEGHDPGAEPTLTVVVGGRRDELEALPSVPNGADGVWRAAFAGSPEAIEQPGAAFELAAASVTVELPPPDEQPGAAQRPAPERRSDPAPAPPQPPGRRWDDDLRHATRRASELEARLEVSEDERRDLQERLEAAVRERGEVEGRLVALTREHAELDGRLEALTRDHADVEQQLEAAETELDDLERTLDALGADRQAALQESDALRDHVSRRDALIERARADLARLPSAIEALELRAVELRDGVVAHAEAAAGEQRSTHDRAARESESLVAARAEIERHAERVADLERAVEGFREAVVAQLETGDEETAEQLHG